MASNQYSTTERDGEREIKLLSQTHSPEVDYSLFIMLAVLVMSERFEKRPGMALAVLPPSIFACTAFISWFRVSLSPPRGNASGGIYIALFRLRRST
jgi:hypothetical protein